MAIKDKPDWVSKTAYVMRVMNMPPDVIRDFKKAAPPKIPSSGAEIEKMLKDAGVSESLVQFLHPFLKWVGSLEYP